jgi:hypothetical protein
MRMREPADALVRTAPERGEGRGKAEAFDAKHAKHAEHAGTQAVVSFTVRSFARAVGVIV